MKKTLKLLLITLLLGCDKEIPAGLQAEAPKLVVYAFLNPQEVASVWIDRTYPPTGELKFGSHVSAAVVNLYENGVFIERLAYYAETKYVSKKGFKPSAGRQYHLEISATGYPSVKTSTETVPLPLKANEVVFKEQIKSFYNDGNFTKKLHFDFADASTAKDQFAIQVKCYKDDENVGSVTFDLEKPNEVQDACGKTANYNTFLINDICFSDGKIVKDIGVELEGTGQTTSERQKTNRVLVFLRNISLSYYKFLGEFAAEGIEKAFGERKSGFSNIQNGYGVFGTYNETKLELKP